MDCPKCGAVRYFSWDGGSHKCLVANKTRVEWSWITSRIASPELVTWLRA